MAMLSIPPPKSLLDKNGANPWLKHDSLVKVEDEAVFCFMTDLQALNQIYEILNCEYVGFDTNRQQVISVSLNLPPICRESVCLPNA